MVFALAAILVGARWWITLAVVGIVLLVIAVGSERRAGDGGQPTARLRDLR